MMMVDNVVALLRPQHDWYYVMADERADLLRLLLSQSFAFFLDLAHADSDLGGTQAFDWDRLQNKLAHVSHGFLPAGIHKDRTPTHTYQPTREPAMAALPKQYGKEEPRH